MDYVEAVLSGKDAKAPTVDLQDDIVADLAAKLPQLFTEDVKKAMRDAGHKF